jgi:hypothetical protein
VGERADIKGKKRLSCRPCVIEGEKYCMFFKCSLLNFGNVVGLKKEELGRR